MKTKTELYNCKTILYLIIKKNTNILHICRLLNKLKIYYFIKN